jgi:hypothetical protein
MLNLESQFRVITYDVETTAYVWDASGAVAPAIAFDWRCRVVVNTIN